MYKKDDINNLIERVVSLISQEYPVKRVYLFGSYANGHSDESSDIDIAVVSDKFEGNRFIDRENLGKYIVKVSADIDIHPFKTEEFTPDNPFVKEIIETGLQII